MKERLSRSIVTGAKKRVKEWVTAPSFEMRLLEVVSGLALARYGDLPLAAVGTLAVLHGIAGGVGHDRENSAGVTTLTS